MFNVNGFRFRAISPASLDEEADGRFYLMNSREVGLPDEDGMRDELMTAIKFGLEEEDFDFDEPVKNLGFFSGQLTISSLGCFPWMGYVSVRTIQYS